MHDYHYICLTSKTNNISFIVFSTLTKLNNVLTKKIFYLLNLQNYLIVGYKRKYPQFGPFRSDAPRRSSLVDPATSDCVTRSAIRGGISRKYDLSRGAILVPCGGASVAALQGASRSQEAEGEGGHRPPLHCTFRPPSYCTVRPPSH